MADTETNKTQSGAKRGPGRPRKTPPKQPIVSEDNERLEMTASEKGIKEGKVTIEDVQERLNGFYTKVLGATNIGDAWIGGVNNLSRLNPFLQNQRLKMINTYPGSLSRENLIKALDEPQNYETGLRAVSWSLSASQYLYYKILRMATDIPMFLHWKTPEFLPEEEYSKNKFIEDDEFVENWLDTFDLKNTFKRISLEVKREGKCSYVLRNSISEDEKGIKTTNYATLQKLPSNYIKLTGIGEHGYTVSFNMMLFMNPAFSILQYPEFIQNIWFDMINSGAIVDNYLNGRTSGDRYSIDPEKLTTYAYNIQEDGSYKEPNGILEIKKLSKRSTDMAYLFWAPLPQELVYTFCSDTSHAWVVPDTTGMILGLQELTDYDTLAGLLQSTPLTAVLTAEIEPISSNQSPGGDQTIMNPETILGYQNKFQEMVSSNIDAFFAPLKNFKLQNLPDVPNSSNTTTKATQNFMYRNGLGALIATEKPSIGQTNVAKLLAEQETVFVTLQFESVINYIINNLIGCEYKWKIHIWGTIFSFNDELKRDKELFIAGGTFVLPKLLSAYNLSTRDSKAINLYIKSLKIYDDLKTITQAQQQEQIKTQQSQGRPALSENDINNDNTAASKDGGLDTKDTRDYASEYEFDGKCILCGKESETPICEECKEKYFENEEEM